jgi:hypothetical protein
MMEDDGANDATSRNGLRNLTEQAILVRWHILATPSFVHSFLKPVESSPSIEHFIPFGILAQGTSSVFPPPPPTSL